MPSSVWPNGTRVLPSETEVRLPAPSVTCWVPLTPSVIWPSGANRLPFCWMLSADTVMLPPADRGTAVLLPAGASKVTLPGVVMVKLTAETG
jgi:hypothetical protein